MEAVNTPADMMTSWLGIAALVIFVLSYLVIAMEERLHINKSKPALFAGTSIFILIGIHNYLYDADPQILHNAVAHLVMEIASIFFFLYVAMTYIEVLIERGVFNKLKASLISRGYNYSQLFWITGALAFFISPIADNLTTALILSTVLITIEQKRTDFLIASAINIVVAANAGGAWSPFGDITTLMVWTAGKGGFVDFLFLFPASFFGWLITAYLLSKYLPRNASESGPVADFNPMEMPEIKNGGKFIIFLGISTITIAVVSHQQFHLPPFWGMMFGLSLLKIYAYFLKISVRENINIFGSIARIENDTLLFFFGLLSAVAGLSYIGYLAVVADVYNHIDPTIINVGIGFISAIIDNVPVMFSVLQANPELPVSQWLLVTLTAGIGGSLIAFGSAAGIGVMGKLRGIYTFGSHMRLSWTIIVGYTISIGIWYF
ncbi:MAG: sodium:proton antiporter NhaD, partial [Gammaproteobacteria bacterium]|nr:sodium:proton antiporter NhaD [Gammaproteobacteria bacterium]